MINLEWLLSKREARWLLSQLFYYIRLSDCKSGLPPLNIHQALQTSNLNERIKAYLIHPR